MTDEHQRSFEELITEARRLMRESTDAWRSITGRLEVRNDEAWLDEGRKRYHASAAMETSTAPDISVVNYSFSVRRTPWRVRMQLMHAAGVENAKPDLIICRDQIWWMRTGAAVKTNKANLAHRIGLSGLDLMICPKPLADIMDYREARETIHDRRAAILVLAGASEMLWWHAPEQVVLSVSFYELEVDSELGILLANRAYIDDRIARDIVLHDIRVDPSLDDETEFGIPVPLEEGHE
jgi:hypothetical protein